MGPTKVKALCVATRCATPEQFVATFHRFSDERSFFVATLNARPIGLETPFSIQLADRTPVLRGTCVVLAAWTTGDNPFKRPGIQLGIQRLTPDSERVFQQLQVARRAAPPEPITEHSDPPSEALAAVSIPPIPGAKAPKPPTMPMPMVSRTQTARRVMTEPVPSIAAPPKSPPEAKLLEVILPPGTEIKPAGESTVETRALEQRTPGSELILPANPLQNMTDGMLEGFVDCTLYEETATFFRGPDDSSDFGDPAAPPRPALPPAQLIEEAIHASSGLFALQPSGEMVPIVVENPTTGQYAPIVVENQQQRAHRLTGQQLAVSELRPHRLTGPQMPVRTHRTTGQQTGTMPPFIMQTSGSSVGPLPTGQMAQIVMQTSSSQMGPLPTDPQAPIVMQMQPDPMRKFLGEENVHTPVPAGEAFDAPSRHQHRRTARLAAVTAPRRLMVIGGAALGATLIFVLVLVTRSSASDTSEASLPPPPKPTPPVRAVEPTKPAKPEPRPGVDGTDPTESTEPSGPPLIGEGACKLDVKTTPAGTMVAFDGRSVGPSPITIAGSCDKHKVDFLHPRYKTEQRFVTMTADQVTNLDVSLVRPTHQLRVLTSPPGAEVFIGGRRAGTSPTMVQVNGFSGIDIRVERAGFKPVSTRVYSKVPEDRLVIGLTPVPRPK